MAAVLSRFWVSLNGVQLKLDEARRRYPRYIDHFASNQGVQHADDH
jgi:hypothetical protein